MKRQTKIRIARKLTKLVKTDDVLKKAVEDQDYQVLGIA